jgi:hypothetical protein
MVDQLEAFGSIRPLDSSVSNVQFPLEVADKVLDLDRFQASTCAQRGLQMPMEVSNPVPM